MRRDAIGRAFPSHGKGKSHGEWEALTGQGSISPFIRQARELHPL